MTLTGALILLVVGVLLLLLFGGVLHVIGIICAVVGVIGLLAVVLVRGSSRV
jgi:hypothetical protein